MVEYQGKSVQTVHNNIPMPTAKRLKAMVIRLILYDDI